MCRHVNVLLRGLPRSCYSDERRFKGMRGAHQVPRRRGAGWLSELAVHAARAGCGKALLVTSLAFPFTPEGPLSLLSPCGSRSWLASHLRALPSLHVHPPSPLPTLPPERGLDLPPLLARWGQPWEACLASDAPQHSWREDGGAPAEVAVMSPGPVSELTLLWEPWSWPRPCLHC